MPSLNFKGKALVQNFHLLVPFHELKPVKAKSLTGKPSLHDNLVVHGDIHLEEHRIDFCQLPFEIYKAIKPKKA